MFSSGLKKLCAARKKVALPEKQAVSNLIRALQISLSDMDLVYRNTLLVQLGWRLDDVKNTPKALIGHRDELLIMPKSK